MALEMKFGGDPKQTKIMGGLFALLAVVVYFNYFSGPDTSPATTPRRPPGIIAPPMEAPNIARRPDEKKRSQIDRRAQEFRPRVGSARPEDRPDPMTVDPTLRLEQLARLEKVQISGGARSLFDFSNVNGPAQVAKIIAAPKLKAPPAFIGPLPAPAPLPPVAKVTPQAPPIPLKFYGFTTAQRGSNKRGFFLDGEDILVASEGEVLKKRYKVIRIGLANVTMEDTQFQQQQTLPIVPDNGGGGQ